MCPGKCTIFALAISHSHTNSAYTYLDYYMCFPKNFFALCANVGAHEWINMICHRVQYIRMDGKNPMVELLAVKLAF